MSISGRNFFRGTDAELFTATQVFSTLINSAPADYGISVEMATNYGTLSTAYRTAFTTANTPETRTKGANAAKDTARRALVEAAQVLARIINADPAVTDEMKIDLGLAIPHPRVPVPPPSTAPELDVVSVVGRSVKLRAHGGVLHRGKIDGAAAITFFSFVGETPPPDTNGWNLQGTSGRTTVTINFPAGEATSVWFTAFWQNAKGQYGPACPPIEVNLPASASVPSTEDMRLAA